MLIDFQNSFTDRLCNKSVVKPWLHISPHFKRVATLPCETFVLKRHCAQSRVKRTPRQDTQPFKTVAQKYSLNDVSLTLFTDENIYNGNIEKSTEWPIVRIIH